MMVPSRERERKSIRKKIVFALMVQWEKKKIAGVARLEVETKSSPGPPGSDQPHP